MASEKSVSERFWEGVDYLNPLRDTTTEDLEKKDIFRKWYFLAYVLFGLQPAETTFKPGLLDWCFLGIPKIIYKLGEWLFCLATGEEKLEQIKYQHSWHMFWLWLPLLPIIAQGILAILLALVCFPLVGLVHWLYPVDQDFINQAKAKGEAYEPGAVGRNRRRAFFNPSTWMLGFVVTLAISFLIQGLASNGLIGQEIFAQAVGPLLIMQTVFTGIAALMLVGAVFGLLHHAYELLTTDKKSNSSDYPKSTVVEYFKDFYQWMVDHPAVAVPVMIFGIGSVLAVLILTIGYFTGSGVFGVFDFMMPVFNFVGTGFMASIQGLSTLPGLEFLGGIAAGPGLELAAQIFTIVAMVLGTMFAVDTVRRVTQTATEGPVASDEQDVKQKTYTLNDETEPTKGDPLREQWKERQALFAKQKVEIEDNLKARGFTKKYTVTAEQGTTGTGPWSFFYNYPVIPQGEVVYGKSDVDSGYRECAMLIKNEGVLEVKEGWILANELSGERFIPDEGKGPPKKVN